MIACAAAIGSVLKRWIDLVPKQLLRQESANGIRCCQAIRLMLTATCHEEVCAMKPVWQETRWAALTFWMTCIAVMQSAWTSHLKSAPIVSDHQASAALPSLLRAFRRFAISIAVTAASPPLFPVLPPALSSACQQHQIYGKCHASCCPTLWAFELAYEHSTCAYFTGKHCCCTAHQSCNQPCPMSVSESRF